MKRILLALFLLPLTAHADQLFQHSSTSNIVRIFIEDTSKTGTDASIGLTGVAYDTTGLELHHICDTESADTDYTAAGSTIEDISTLGTFAAPTATKVRFKAVDGTDMPGVYEVQLANARFAVSNARSCILSWKGVANMRAGFKEIPLLSAQPDVTAADLSTTAIRKIPQSR